MNVVFSILPQAHPWIFSTVPIGIALGSFWRAWKSSRNLARPSASPNVSADRPES